jgi:hypothetical protein
MDGGNPAVVATCVSGSDVLPGLYGDCGESGPPSLLQWFSICSGAGG